MPTPKLQSVEVILGALGLLAIIFFISPWGQTLITRAQYKEETRQNNIRLFGRPDVD